MGILNAHACESMLKIQRNLLIKKNIYIKIKLWKIFIDSLCIE